MMNLTPDGSLQHNGYVFITDPLQLSKEESLPFPAHAAARLAEQRSKRYDEVFLALEDVEKQLRAAASIMGMIPESNDAHSFTLAA